MSRRKSKGLGYTIIEVMVVLTITGLLFASVLVLFQSSSGNTQFEQSANDINSKLKNSLKAVTSELYPETEKYSCQIVSEKPVLTAHASLTERGTNQDCLYLGKLLQFVPGQNQLHIYSVIGRRTYPLAGTPERQPVTSFDNAAPTVAITSQVRADLIEDYNFTSNGMTLRYAYVNGDTANEADLAGFFNGIGEGTDTSALTSAASLLAKGYKVKTDPSALQVNLQNCVSGAASGPCGRLPPAQAIVPFGKWELCLADDTVHQTALISVTTTANDAQTTLKLKGC